MPGFYCRQGLLVHRQGAYPAHTLVREAFPVLRGHYGIGWMVVGWVLIVVLIAMGIVAVSSLGLFH
jgi:hypothetical protein